MTLLADTLRFAVPMWAMQMEGWPKERLQQIAHECASAVTEGADTLLFKGKDDKGRQKTRDTFNALAQGTAILVLMHRDWDFEAWLAKLSRDEDAFRGAVPAYLRDRPTEAAS